MKKYGLFYTKEDLLKYYPKNEVEEYVKAVEILEQHKEACLVVEKFDKKLNLLFIQRCWVNKGSQYVYRQKEQDFDKLIMKLTTKNLVFMKPILEDFFLFNECVAEYGYQQNSGEQLAYMVAKSRHSVSGKKILSKLIIENCPYGPEFGFAMAKETNYKLSESECNYLNALKNRNKKFREENIKLAAERVKKEETVKQ